MTKVLVTESHLSDIADAIRAQNGTQTQYTPGQMAAAIEDISGGLGPEEVNVVATNSLPNEYQGAEYIHFDDSSYLTVNHTIVNGEHVETYSKEDSGVSGEKDFIGYSEYWAFGYRDDSRPATFTWISGNWDRAIIDIHANVFYKNSIADRTIMRFNSTNSNADAFYVGKHRLDRYPYEGRIYSVRFYTINEIGEEVNTVLLLPCYRKSDGVIGMYDVVSGVFYTNSGSGTITKGSDYDPVDYNIISKGNFIGGNSNPLASDGSIGQYYVKYRSEMMNKGAFNCSNEIAQYVVPHTGTYKLEVYGGKGGDAKLNDVDINFGGLGGYSFGEVQLTAGDVLYVVVGGNGVSDYKGRKSLPGGFNGGGDSFSDSSLSSCSRASGGGATHIALRSGLLSELENYTNDVLIVAGGGGGASNFNNYKGYGGAGGGLTGGDGVGSDGTAGLGGTQSSGGTGQYNGSFGQGGSVPERGGHYGGAGGGGGYYGGGSGGNNISAGGGSGYLSPSLSNASMLTGVSEEPKAVIIDLSDSSGDMYEKRTPIAIFYKTSDSTWEV